VIRDIDFVSIKNTFAGSHTITVEIRATTGGPFVLVKCALLTDESLSYTHGSGWVALDANGNRKEVTASVFSSLTVTGAATVGTTLGVNGNTTLSGTGNVITGTATNDSAASGKVGEYIESVQSAASPLSISNATVKDITTISLTAGDWDVYGHVGLGSATTVAWTQWRASISTAAATLQTDQVAISRPDDAVVQASGAVMVVPSRRLSLASTTTIYLNTYALFSGGSGAGAYGTILARRRR
jgi:hypothetical protein